MSGIDPESPPLPGETHPPPQTPVNPWLGLASYTEQDRDTFFGRERETTELLRLIEREVLTVLFGRSGLGKTSLLRAGVIPQLRKSAYFPVVLRLDFSGQGLHPVAQVIALLREAAKSDGIDLENEPENASGVTLWEFFHTVELWGPRNDRLTPILVFDQFEEVFTIGRNVQQAAEFLEQLADLVEKRTPRVVRDRLELTGRRLDVDTGSHDYKIVLSLREDFVSKLDSLRPILPAIMRNRFSLNPLDGERALEVIVHAGREWVTEDVARDIVAAVAGRADLKGDSTSFSHAEIEPAYLSVMCHELFRRMLALERTAITRDLVAQEHGGILEGLYERSFEGIDRLVRLFVEDRLLTAGGFRGTVPLSEAIAEGISAGDLDVLVDRRLLRFEDRLGTRHVELSHDQLIRVVQKSRNERRAQEQVEAERLQEAKLRRQLVRSRMRAAVAGIAALLLLAGIAFYWLGYLREYVTYSKSFTKSFGTIVGIGPVSRNAVQHRNWSLKIIRKGFFGPVLAVEAVDSSGELTTRHGIGTILGEGDDSGREKPCRWEFVYDPQGHVVYEIARDRFRRMVWGVVYAPGERADGKHLRSAKVTFIGADGYPQPQRQSHAEFVEITYNDKGYETKHIYMDRAKRPAPGPDGAFGRGFEYDGVGRRTKIISLDRDGKPKNDYAGNATLLSEYDKDSNESTSTALDELGRPTLFNKGQFSKYQFKYDNWGNVIERAYMDLQGRPTRNTESGAYVVRYKYDDRGNTTEWLFFDANNNPVERQGSDFPYHHEKDTYERNHLISESYFDRDDRPVFSPKGWHEVRRAYDPKGFEREWQYFGKDNQPVNLTSGYQKIVQVNDVYGQPVEARFYRADSTPALEAKDRYHMRRSRYDERGNLIEQSYFGIHDEPVVYASTGEHRFVKRYDRFGNPTLFAYYDDQDRPTLCRAGYHQKKEQFDDFGDVETEEYFGAKLEPVPGPNGAHLTKSAYDANGLLSEVKYFGLDGKKEIEDKRGIHRIMYVHNDKRQLTHQEFFGLNDRPAADSQGVHLLEREFNAAGGIVREKYVGTHGEGVWDRELKVATMRQTLIPHGTWTEKSYYDDKDQLVVGPLGFAKGASREDPDGGFTEQYFGPDGRLMFNKLVGFARKVDTNKEKPLTGETYYGADGSIIEGPAGFAIHRIELDFKGGLLRDEYLDRQGHPTYGPGGYYRKEKQPNSKEEKLYDAGNHLLNPNDAATVIYINSIASLHSPAFKIGILPGDIILSLCEWSHDDALRTAQSKTKDPDELWKLLRIGFGDVSQNSPCTMNVLRDSKLVKLSVPARTEKRLGITISPRRLPRIYYEGTILKSAADDTVRLRN
jgi:YD repeat-containing protein